MQSERQPTSSQIIRHKLREFDGPFSKDRQPGRELGRGGYFPSDVTVNIETSLQNEDKDYIFHTTRLVQRLFLDDPVSDFKLNSSEMILAEINKLLEIENDSTIYYVSLPVNNRHQVSLVIDNKEKIIYIADSLKQANDYPILKSFVGMKSIIIDNDIETQQRNEINCGMHTYINTRNRIAKLLGMAANQKLDRQLIVKNIILETIPVDKKGQINPISLEIAATVYLEYENNNYDPEIEKGFNKLLPYLFKEIPEEKLKFLQEKSSVMDKIAFLYKSKVKHTERLLHNQLLSYLDLSQTQLPNEDNMLGLMANKDFNPNLQGNDGKTILHHIIERIGFYPDEKDNLIKLIKLLLNKGADPALMDNFAQTPLSLTKQINHVKSDIYILLTTNYINDNSYSEEIRKTLSYKKIMSSIRKGKRSCHYSNFINVS